MIVGWGGLFVDCVRFLMLMDLFGVWLFWWCGVGVFVLLCVSLIGDEGFGVLVYLFLVFVI